MTQEPQQEEPNHGLWKIHLSFFASGLIAVLFLLACLTLLLVRFGLPYPLVAFLSGGGTVLAFMSGRRLWLKYTVWRLSKKELKDLLLIFPAEYQMIEESVALMSEDKSLVRASSEPMEEQEKVLLRVAEEIEETPSEQLLRPVSSCRES